TKLPSACRVWASTQAPRSRPISFRRIAPASGSPRAVTATPIAARSQRRISALTQMPLLSRASILRRGALQPGQALKPADAAVAIECDQVAVGEQEIGGAALVAGHVGGRVDRPHQGRLELGAEIGLGREQRDQRRAFHAAVAELEDTVALGRTHRFLLTLVR